MKNFIVITIALGALALSGTAEEAEKLPFGAATFVSD